MRDKAPKQDREKTIRRYAVCFAIGAAVAALYMATHDFGAVREAGERYRILSDAFSIPGVLFLGSGLLSWTAGKGAFDGMSYSCGLFFKVINPFRKFEREDYPAYVERKSAGRRAKGSRLYLYVTGGVFSGAAGVFLLLFHAT